MSGTVATFTLKADSKVSVAKLQTELPKALKASKLAFNGLSMKMARRAEAAYVLQTPGLT